ncbi:MAG: hypothetical protein Q4G70_15515 [Pseudomonadota bacterium]|nr:hypothetical protein [Pseudomonadota bacterium]
MSKIKRTERLLGLFVLGWLLLSFPLFSIWDRDTLVLGWPMLPTAAFVIWLLVIVALAVLMETDTDGDGDPDEHGTPRSARWPGR